MANYPTYDIGLGSSQDLESGIDDDFSEPGIHHSRILHGKQYYRFGLVHHLTRTQFAALLATYAATPRAVFTLSYYVTSPLTTYSVKFTDAPKITTNQGGERVEVKVSLRGFKD